MAERIELARRDDALILGALTLQTGREYGGSPRRGFIDEFADAWLADFDRTPTWIAFADNGSAVGMVVTSYVRKLPSLTRATTAWLHVKNVYVAPEARGHGLAERMLRAMIAWGDEQMIERYQLNTQPRARGLYERVGFCAPADGLMELRRG